MRLEVLEEITKETLCHHCGDECVDDQIHFDGREFCCYGCKAVYELITNSHLKQYYDNADLKTEKIKDISAVERKFAFLDHKNVTEKLLRYHDDEKSIVNFYLAGIHCSSCIYLLEHLPKLDDRILTAEVNFIRKEITVAFDNTMSLKSLAIRLTSLGYEPTINLDSVSGKNEVKPKNRLAIKIAVAGFCFGNSMLISLPEYLDVGFQFESTFKSLFGWINLVLVFPVVFYAAQDYYKSAWIGLKHKYLNIDVPITLGILTLLFRSIYEIVFAVGPGFIDSLNGLVFFLLIGKWYQSKSYQALSFERDYKSYFPVSVIRILDGVEENVMLQDLVVGDRIVIHNQELIPADGRIVEGKGRIDYSFVTGEADPILKSSNEKVFAGGLQIGNQIIVQLEKAVSNSELTQLWNDKGTSKKATKYDSLIDKVSIYFTLIVIALAIGTGIYWSQVDPSMIWDTVAAVLIVACPCALALALPFGLGHGMRVLGLKGLYLKNANVIEHIAKIKTIVFDKTGTLTKNDPHGISFEGQPLSLEELSIVKSVCSNSAHPLSKLIANYISEDIEKKVLDDFEEEIGKGVLAKSGTVEVKIGSARWIGVYSDKGSKSSHVHIELNHNYRGYFSIKASYRDGIFDLLSKLKTYSKLHLLSGDNDTEINNLKPYFAELHFNQRPKDKLDYLQSIDEQVLMVGDGLNDAGALQVANVGISVCEDIHQFSPACDALIQSKDITSLSKMMRFSKSVMVTIVMALILSFAYNIVGLSFAISGNLTPVVSAILMPVSSITVVAFITMMVNINAYRFLRK